MEGESTRAAADDSITQWHICGNLSPLRQSMAIGARGDQSPLVSVRKGEALEESRLLSANHFGHGWLDGGRREGGGLKRRQWTSRDVNFGWATATVGEADWDGV